jgi:hypothetical protein
MKKNLNKIILIFIGLPSLILLIGFGLGYLIESKISFLSYIGYLLLLLIVILPIYYLYSTFYGKTKFRVNKEIVENSLISLTYSPISIFFMKFRYSLTMSGIYLTTKRGLMKKTELLRWEYFDSCSTEITLFSKIFSKESYIIRLKLKEEHYYYNQENFEIIGTGEDCYKAFEIIKNNNFIK